jgi:hypothetical protein
MKADYGTHFNLAERIGNTFHETNNDVCVDLRNNDSEYAAMHHELKKLLDDFPILAKLTGRAAKEPITLSLDEQRALSRYFCLKSDMESYERKEIYFRGHTSSIAYLIKVAGIHIG